VEDAEKRTEIIQKKLRDVEVMPAPSGAQLSLDVVEAEEDAHARIG
jgi:hypothetical protein